VSGASGKQRRKRQLELEKGGGKGSAVGGPAQQVAHSTGWVDGHRVERSNRPMGRLGRN
jgi:hypothetical protein